MLLPPALGFSPHPPVSVCGTGPAWAIAAFLGGSSTSFATSFSLCAGPALLYGHFSHTRPSLRAGLSIPGLRFAAASPQFCHAGVQEYSPAVHRMRP